MSSVRRPFWSLTACELGEAYRAGSASPEEVTRACLDRLEEINPVLNAVVTLDRDGALSAARASTARWKSKTALGPLDGVPATVKDNLFVAGLRATWGSLLYADHVAPVDDLPVEKLRAGGAVILGKTNTPEMALSGYTDNRVFGATGNPWAPELSPGGSSGGAAAAIMSGMAPLAIVTDGAGSTRRPACHTGCVGLKPAPGRIPRRHGFPSLSVDLQSIGVMARTVRDARLLFDCVAMPAPDNLARKPRLKIGAFCRIGDAPVEPDIARAWRQACKLLAALGHEVVEIAAPYDPDEAGVFFHGLAAAAVSRIVRGTPGWETKVMPVTAELAEKGAQLTASEYVALLDRLAAFRWQLADAFTAVDLFLTPTAAGLLWPKSEASPKQIDGKPVGPRASAIYTSFVNVAALAGISIPAGSAANGHPIGVQLVGPAGSEETLLDVASQFEQAQPWPLLAKPAA